MKILVINPNTSLEMTKTIELTAKKYASPGTEISTISPEDGPSFIGSAYDVALQAPRVIELVEENKESHDSFIIACGVDPGLQACRLVAKNVIGIGEAALLTACAVARQFSVLGVLKGGGQSVGLQLRGIGMDPARCASVRIVGSGLDDEIVTSRHQMLDAYCQVGQRCIDEDGAGALVFSCAGMSDLKEYLEERLKVPVISGVVCATKIAEQLPSW